MIGVALNVIAEAVLDDAEEVVDEAFDAVATIVERAVEGTFDRVSLMSLFGKPWTARLLGPDKVKLAMVDVVVSGTVWR